MAKFNKYETKKGQLWEYRIYYKDPLTQEHKELKKRGFKTKAEAKAAADDIEQDLKQGFKQDDITLKEFIYKWLDTHKKPNIKESTYLNKKQQIDLHIVPYFQNIKLQDITHDFYQSFQKHLDEKGYSKSTCANNHWIVHEMFERAIFQKIIKFNPAEKAVIMGKKKQNEDELEYIPSQLIPALLLEAYRDSFEYYLFFKTLVETGMRKGEAAGLTWNDIDFEKNLIHITKSLDTQHGKTGSTKTFSSKRTIGIAPRLIDELKKLRKRQLENMMAWGDKYDREKNLVFCRPKGEFYPKSTLFNCFRRYQNKSGIEAGIDENKEVKYYPIHALRHTHAVVCLENEMDMLTLQERLGHKNYEVTANVYSHVSDKIREKKMDKYIEGTAELFAPVQLEGVFN